MKKQLLFFAACSLWGAAPLFAALQTIVSPPGAWPVVVRPLIELAGSNESQIWQNYMADHENLFRVGNRKQLLFLEKKGILVPLPQTNVVRIDPRLRKNPEYCYALPRVPIFLLDRAHEYKHELPNAAFELSSAVRDEVRQKSIRRGGNQNAADATGPKASSHLTGATIDITKRRMTKAQIEWWRTKLLDLECQGVIEATEEFRQACFHIMVFGSYKQMYPVATENQVKAKPGKRHIRKHKK